MSVELSSPPNIAAPHPELGAHESVQERDAMLRKLLPYDYDFARESGLIDMFQYDPKTGEDGLLHTLVGGIATSLNGTKLPQGFHHEPSAEILSSKVTTPQGEEQALTRVDRTHLLDANSKTRKRFMERPLEPYGAHVVIDGFRKMRLARDDEGKHKLVPVINSMFPKEYDALAVMQTIRQAYEGLDESAAQSQYSDQGEEVLINEGRALLMDGKSHMRIRFVLDKDTYKIKAAMPMDANGIMKLSEDEANRVIYGS